MAARRFPDAASRRRYWLEHVTRWESSGQSIMGYCSAHELSEKSFHYWKKMVKHSAASSEGTRLSFAELQLVAPQQAAIEIALGEGRRVQVHPGFDEDTLARVLAVLERAS